MTTFAAARFSRLLPLLAAAALAAPLTAQNCFFGDFGTRIGAGTTDTVYAMRPIGFAFPLNGATYTHIHVNDHGFVQLSNGGVPAPLTSGSAALYTPTAANFVAGGPKIAPLYSDITLANGGECYLKSTATQCTVTWHDARPYGFVAPRFTFQLALQSNGAVRFVYGPGCSNQSTAGGVSANAIVGVTPGGGSAPAPVDFAAGGTNFAATTYEAFVGANTFDLASNSIRLSPSWFGTMYAPLGAPVNCPVAARYGVGCDGMKLAGVGLPAIGNAGFQLRADAVPAVSPLAFFAFGSAVQDPGVGLGALLGMTGCTAYTNADLGFYAGTPKDAAGASVCSLPVPATAALVGMTLSVQALGLSLANAFGIAASNGVELRVGEDGSSVFLNPALQMVPIVPGTFSMGSSAASPDVEAMHPVTLTRAFWMAKHEVTQAQFQAVMGSNPSYFQGAAYANAAQRPVESVSWNDAMAYCAALTASEAAAGRVPAGYQYRLPTEAEWEYCCRAGTTTPWYTGAGLLTSQANFAGAVPDGMFGSSGQTAAVGSYAPNAWGLHDMHGNVQEWCLDRHGIFTSAPATDPYVLSGVYRVLRGGDFHVFTPAANCRSARRNFTSETASIWTVGFRVVLGPTLVP